MGSFLPFFSQSLYLTRFLCTFCQKLYEMRKNFESLCQEKLFLSHLLISKLLSKNFSFLDLLVFTHFWYFLHFFYSIFLFDRSRKNTIFEAFVFIIYPLYFCLILQYFLRKFVLFFLSIHRKKRWSMQHSVSVDMRVCSFLFSEIEMNL